MVKIIIMNTFKIIFIKVFLLLSCNSFALDVFLKSDIPNEKEKIYIDIINSLTYEFNEINFFNENDIDKYQSQSEFVFVIGADLVPFIIKNNEFSSKKIVLLGEYSVPNEISNLENWKMISLFPEPELFIKSITEKFSDIETIHFVSQSGNRDSWFSEKISLNQKVMRYETTNIKDGLKIYRDIFSKIKKNDVILMTPDSFFDRIIQTDIIRNAWDKEILTISVLPSSVKRGFFLSAIKNKDNFDYFMNYLENYDKQDKITGFNNIVFHYNERVARHLGYNRKFLMDNFEIGVE